MLQVNTRVRSYKHYIKHNERIKGEKLNSLSLFAYLKFVTNQLGMNYKEEKKLITKCRDLSSTVCQGIHPVAVVCSVLHTMHSYKLRELSSLGRVSPQTLSKCISLTRGYI